MTQQTLSTVWTWLIRTTWVSYGIVLVTLTHMPIPPRTAVVTSQWDKSLHLVAYGVLAVLTAAVFFKVESMKFPKRRILMWLMVFAALDEILQGPVGRTPDTIDWLFDVAGIGMGLILSQLVVWYIVDRGWLWTPQSEMQTN